MVKRIIDTLTDAFPKVDVVGNLIESGVDKQSHGVFLLEAMRTDRNLSVTQLCKRAGVPENKLIAAVKGFSVISFRDALALCEAMGSSPEEKKAVLSALRADKPRASQEKKRNPEKMRALDSNWLDTQPEALRAGLLLTALIERSDVYQQLLAEMLGIDPTTLHYWKKGETKIPFEMVDPIADALALNAEDKASFLVTVELSRNHELDRNKPVTLTPARNTTEPGSSADMVFQELLKAQERYNLKSRNRLPPELSPNSSAGKLYEELLKARETHRKRKDNGLSLN